MSMISAGYDLAMEYYNRINQSQQFNNLAKNNLNKISNDNTKINNVDDTSIKTDKSKDFGDLLSEKVSSSQTYNVGGYNIKIPSLSNSKVQNTIKAEGLDNIIKAASTKYDIPEALIYKVIETESYFNGNVVSSSGAQGLMQIMPMNFNHLGVSDAKDPYQNIMGGTKLLREYLDLQDGDLKLGLASYNAGPGNVRKYGGVPPFTETQNYIRKILGVNP